MGNTDAESAPGGVGLHVCCAPCLAKARSTESQSSGKIPRFAKVFFYNPNIHPLLEFRRRLKALRIYLERDSLSAEIDGEYGLDPYLEWMFSDGGLPKKRRDRCYKCYLLRLGQVAGRAAEEGLTAFTTALFSSTHQDHDLIEAAGKESAGGHDIEFVRHDFSAAEADAKIMRGIYKQQYCGCIFSEEERYRDTNKHLYFPGENISEDD